MECEFCGEFVPDEDYNAHLEIKHPEQYRIKLFVDAVYTKEEKSRQQLNVILNDYTSRIEHALEKFFEHIQPPAIAEPLPIKKYPIASMQLTQIVATSGKSVDEVLSIYNEISEKLEKEEEKASSQ